MCDQKIVTSREQGAVLCNKKNLAFTPLIDDSRGNLGIQ